MLGTFGFQFRKYTTSNPVTKLFCQKWWSSINFEYFFRRKVGSGKTEIQLLLLTQTFFELFMLRVTFPGKKIRHLWPQYTPHHRCHFHTTHTKQNTTPVPHQTTQHYHSTTTNYPSTHQTHNITTCYYHTSTTTPPPLHTTMTPYHQRHRCNIRVSISEIEQKRTLRSLHICFD